MLLLVEQEELVSLLSKIPNSSFRMDLTIHDGNRRKRFQPYWTFINTHCMKPTSSMVPLVLFMVAGLLGSSSQHSRFLGKISLRIKGFPPAPTSQVLGLQTYATPPDPEFSLQRTQLNPQILRDISQGFLANSWRGAERQKFSVSRSYRTSLQMFL